MVNRSNPFTDTCVMYYSRSDKCWVAHSLRTDQIGTGNCILEALAGLIRAVKLIRDDAARDPTLAVFREAPDSIKKMAAKAEPLPREIFDIACKIVHGDWPPEVEPAFKIPRSHPYQTEIMREVAFV